MEKHLKIAKTLSILLDNRFSILGFRFGLDPILGLIPGGGDLITLFISLYVIWIAIGMKIPSKEVWRMVFHIIIDFLIGLIPFIGDLSDFFYKANIKNMKIVEKYRVDVIDGETI
ncbi:MAG: DUF4112 domain-containing protein [Candidatus Roizmanbacteria bacterium]